MKLLPVNSSTAKEIQPTNLWCMGVAAFTAFAVGLLAMGSLVIMRFENADSEQGENNNKNVRSRPSTNSTTSPSSGSPFDWSWQSLAPLPFLLSGNGSNADITENQLSRSQPVIASLSPSYAPSQNKITIIDTSLISESIPQESLFPAMPPSLQPSNEPTTLSTSISVWPSGLIVDESDLEFAVTIFYAIGDVPYSSRQEGEIAQQLLELPDDAEFVIHIGDLRDAAPTKTCLKSEYETAARLFRHSHAPVFLTIGDNDWTDCPNREEGLEYWYEEFQDFESRNWNHTFTIVRQPDRPENFAFVHKGSLFMGMNIIGGEVHDQLEWETRLTDEVNWTVQLIRDYLNIILSHHTGNIVIFGHANPNSRHDAFFKPLESFIKDELQNAIPILYLHGDTHKWLYEPNFKKLPSFLRIMVTGMTKEPPLKVSVQTATNETSPEDVFVYDRRL